MRIAVGFKVTPDFEALRPADWARMAAAESSADRAEVVRYVRRVLGVFDEAALELALRLRDARAELGLETGLSAFSVAGPEVDPFLATVRALGFETARVDPGDTGAHAGLDFAPAATAALVAAGTERLGGDVLLLGSRCGPGESGTVPVFAAEALGRPYVTEVTEIEPATDERLRVTFTADDGPMRATIAPPCVLAVGNAVVSMLRVPTLRDRLARRDAPTSVLEAVDLGVDVPALLASGPTAPSGLETVDRSRGGVVVGGATAEAKARRLYEDHLRGRLEQL